MKKLIFIIFLMVPLFAANNYIIYIMDDINWKDLKYEVMEIRFNDLTFYITSNDPLRCMIGVRDIVIEVEKICNVTFHRKVMDIISIKHNHTSASVVMGFSDMDIKTYHRFIAFDFKGKFLLHTINNKEISLDK